MNMLEAVATEIVATGFVPGGSEFSDVLFNGMPAEELARVLGDVDIDGATSFDSRDRELIAQFIVENNLGSSAAFNACLKLTLLLVPTFHDLDIQQLTRRSEGTIWDFTMVTDWLTKNRISADASTPRCLCVVGPAGTGPSASTSPTTSTSSSP